MTILQILIIVISLVLFIGRIFFGMFKHLSPFKFKNTGSACAQSELDYEERADDSSETSSPTSGGISKSVSLATSSPISSSELNKVEASQHSPIAAQPDGIISDESNLKDNAITTSQESQRESRKKRFKKVNFQSVS
jgi:hypothetical protein